MGNVFCKQSDAVDPCWPITRIWRRVTIISTQSDSDYDSVVDQLVIVRNSKMEIPEDEREELPLLEEKAGQGDVETMVQVAEIYSIYEVYDEALRYYEMAASHGNPEALNGLADMYFYGWGVSVDVNKALHYYEQAADKGSWKAMSQLADIYSNGEEYGVTRDLDMALHYFEKGADAGDKFAQYVLGLFYQGRYKNNKTIPGAQVDEEKAFKLFQQNAEVNDEYSMYELGRCYRDGKGTDTDPVKAKEWFVKASAKGHMDSLFGLAVMVVDESLTDTEKQFIDDLIYSRSIYAEHNEWFQWYSNKKVKTSGQIGNNDSSQFADLDLDLADATFLLARLLASTLDQDQLRIANKLITNIKKDELDKHELLAWLSVLVEDLCKENEEFSCIQESKEETFDMQKHVRPIALIGQGQFGKVYLAWYSPSRLDLLWDRHGAARYVAIKFVDIDLTKKDRALARNVVREQFTCRVLRKEEVKDTVQYLGYADLLTDRERGLVFELCADIAKVKKDAEEARNKINWDAAINLEALPNWTWKVPSSLRSCVVFPKKGSKKWTPGEVITVLRKAAEALCEVHKLGFIHRDIAPRNILCDGKQNIQLADFGWAKFVGSSYDDASLLEYYGKACFSDKHQYALAWWAPECFGSDAEGVNAIFSWQSDVYAFGITMWQCFAGKDPFSDVKDPEQTRNKILEGKRPCVEKKPDVGAELDGNTPDDLIKLIESCWGKKARNRPTLDHVIEELARIEINLQNCRLPQSGNRAYKEDPCNYWQNNDIYRFVKGHGKNPLNEDLYDVFFVHAGEQKWDRVDTMYGVFQEENGLRCFLDCKMKEGCHPRKSMRFALTTCRYAVVVLSSEFFKKRHPASELMYAFERMQWIRQQDHFQGWDSLIVVLYNITVEEYKARKRIDGIELPDSLCSEVKVLEWLDSAKKSWYERCKELKADVIKQDKGKNAFKMWEEYLKQYNIGMPSDFPSADKLYPEG